MLLLFRDGLSNLRAPVQKFWGLVNEQITMFAFVGRHLVHSTVVRPFCNIGG